MKRAIFFSIIAMMMSVSHVQAQKLVHGNTNSFEDCKSYLSENATDTVVSVTRDGKAVKVFVGADGRIKRTITGTAGISAEFFHETHAVKSAKSTSDGAERVEKNGQVTKFAKTTINSMSYEDQLDYIHGSLEVYNTKNRGLDGKLQQRYMAYALGGVFYGDKLAPQVTVGLQKDFFKTISFGAEAEYSQLRYGDTAEAKGLKYDSFAIYINGKWYFLNNGLLGGGSRLGIGTAWGYMLQRTDSDEATDHSKNYGVSAKFFIDAQLSLGKNWYGLAQGGIKWYPHVDHHLEGESGAQKFFDKIGYYGQLGIGYRF
jgi:hypothetical protein